MHHGETPLVWIHESHFKTAVDVREEVRIANLKVSLFIVVAPPAKVSKTVPYWATTNNALSHVYFSLTQLFHPK